MLLLVISCPFSFPNAEHFVSVDWYTLLFIGVCVHVTVDCTLHLVTMNFTACVSSLRSFYVPHFTILQFCSCTCTVHMHFVCTCTCQVYVYIYMYVAKCVHVELSIKLAKVIRHTDTHLHAHNCTVPCNMLHVYVHVPAHVHMIVLYEVDSCPEQ